MEEQGQQQQFNGIMSNNAGYTGDSILRIRLDTEILLKQIESFLRGQIISLQVMPDGTVRNEVIQQGSPLANDTGVHAIMSYANASLNSQTVQGNYEWDHWREEVSWIREQLATDIFVNYDEWGINPQNINLICNVVMNMIKPFMTRLVNNEERKSYSNYQEVRNMPSEPKKGIMSSIFG